MIYSIQIVVYTEKQVSNNFLLKKNNFFFSYLGFSLDSRPGYWWTAVWIACGLGTIVIAVLILRCIEEVIV